MTLGRKVGLFLRKKSLFFFMQWSFSKRELYFVNTIKSKKNDSFSKLEFHQISRLPDHQI